MFVSFNPQHQMKITCKLVWEAVWSMMETMVQSFSWGGFVTVWLITSHHITIIPEYHFSIWVCAYVGLPIFVWPLPPTTTTPPFSVNLTQSLMTNIWDVLTYNATDSMKGEGGGNKHRIIEIKTYIMMERYFSKS